MSLQCNWFGIRLKLSTTVTDFQHSFEKRFNGFVKQKTEPLFSQSIAIEFETASPETSTQSQLLFSGKFWKTKNTLVAIHNYLLTKTSISYHITDTRITKITLKHQPHILFDILNLLLLGLLKKQLFTILVQDYIEKALLFLAGVNGYGYLHAASVEKQGEIYCFTGMNGAGKSTIAQLFCNDGWKLFSDNYVLFKAGKIFKYPDTPRLSSQSLKMVGRSSVTSKEFGKSSLSVDSLQFSKIKAGKIAKVFLVLRQNEASNKVYKSSRNKTIEKIKTLYELDHEAVWQHPLSLVLKYPDSLLSKLKINVLYYGSAHSVVTDCTK